MQTAVAVAPHSSSTTRRLAYATLSWCFHISLDRPIGYGLRTRDGFQRS
jgi:Domain of unknown function (DUF4260)